MINLKLEQNPDSYQIRFYSWPKLPKYMVDEIYRCLKQEEYRLLYSNNMEDMLENIKESLEREIKEDRLRYCNQTKRYVEVIPEVPKLKHGKVIRIHIE